MKRDSPKHIIDHLSRLEGQLASVRREISKEQPDCIKASSTLLSASRSFAGLRQKFTETFLLKHFISPIKVRDKQMFEQLLSLIKG